MEGRGSPNCCAAQKTYLDSPKYPRNNNNNNNNNNPRKFERFEKVDIALPFE